MKIGDVVKHRSKGWIGIVTDFMKRNPGVLVNISDRMGIKFVWIHRNDLEVIESKRSS